MNYMILSPKRTRRAMGLFLIGMFMIITSNLSAQNERRGDKMKPEERQKHQAERFEKMISKIPDLTEVQKSKMYSIHERYMTQFEKMRSDRPNLSKEDRKNLSIDQKKAMIDKRAMARAEVEKLRLEEREEMKQILTEKQREYVVKMRDKRHKEHKKGQGKRPHPKEKH